ncbi:MAG: leucine-rich repeat protein [Clostridia bacterium]|nr:leucine-rich repeat protein [Clostridia bacterium]
MKRILKTITSILLCITIISVILPQEIIASAETHSGSCEDNLSWSFDTDTGVLTISGTGKMNDYLYDYNVPWYSYRSDIKTVEIKNGVTSIGGCAFYDCTSLTNITIPDSIILIDGLAFENCKSLESISVGENNRIYYSKNNCLIKKKGNILVVGCKNSIIPDSVTSIGSYAFSGCSSLTNITIPDSVTEIGEAAFGGCTSLTSVTIPNGVTIIGYKAFSDCTGLTNITMPNSVTSVSSAVFSGCSSLTSIIIPNDVTEIAFSTFLNCTSLTSVTIPDSVTKIDVYAFRGCTGLTSITIPNSVTAICYGGFWGCTGLENITIPDSVTYIGEHAFEGCTGLASVTIGNSVTSIGPMAFEGCTGLTDIVIPDSVTTIGGAAFYGCTGLVSITLPKSVKSISSNAFGYCVYLSDVYFAGTQQQKNNININNSGNGNAELLYATWHYNYSPQCEHNETEIVNVKSATCTEGGYTGDTECSYCGSLISEGAIIPAIGHDYTAVVTNPTCTKQGYTTYTCSRCKHSYVDDYTEALGHSPGAPVKRNIIAATCTFGGTYDEVVYCTVCGVEISRTRKTTYSIGHDYTGIITKPTCAKGGFTTYICHRCGDSYISDFTPALGHTESDWITDKKAQIGVTGSKHKECTICGELIESATIPAINTNAPTIEVEHKKVCAGKTVEVNIKLKNNPGIASAKIMVYFPSDLLLNKVTFGYIGGQATTSSLDSPVTLNWFNELGNMNTADTIYATLTFTANENAKLGMKNITVEYDPNDIIDINEQSIDFAVIDGGIEVVKYIPGDINSDGAVNNKDIVRLFKYLSGWDVAVNEAALDINGDGEINNKDLLRLFKYLSGWNVQVF